jgi:hypothetical protein
LLCKQEDVVQGKGLFIWIEFSELWPEYLEFVIVFFVAYVLVRLAIGWEFRHLPPKELRWDVKEAGSGIDASKLASRVEELRQVGHAGAVEPSASFKKPLLVEEKRREMEKLPFFQPKPPPQPPPEPPEHAEGMGLLLI